METDVGPAGTWSLKVTDPSDPAAEKVTRSVNGVPALFAEEKLAWSVHARPAV
jgi:hypothetical protein